MRFRRTGGYAGNLPALEVDTAVLPPDQRAEIADLIADVHFDALAARSGPPTPDAFQYELEVTTGSDRRRLVVGERHVPASLRPLIGRLTALARERRG